MTTDDDYGDLVPLGDPPGAVLAGVHAETGQAWALKVLPGRLDRRTRSDMEVELRRLAAVSGDAPIVVADRIVELGDGRRALRRELCAQSLPELIDAFGPLSVQDTRALGAALAEALDAAHAAGVPHGGVTPGNVLFRESGEPVLTDFSTALRRAFPPDPGQDTGFRAPETIRDGVLDESADRYGLGAVLFAALTGHSPFPSRPGEPDAHHVLRVLTEPAPPIDRPDVPADLAELVAGLLAKDPGQRPADVAARLSGPGAVAGAPLLTGTPIIEFGPEKQRRLSRPPVLAAAAVAALLAVVAVLVVLSRPRDTEIPPMDPPPAAAPTSAPGPSRPAIQLALADPVDRGETVDLSWTSSGTGLDFAVTVAPEGRASQFIEVQRETSYTAAVEPGIRYCFEVRAVDGVNVWISPPKAIRGAVCGR